MARSPTGQIIEREGARGRKFALRFRALGRRRYQTTTASTRAEAEEELAYTLQQVKRGLWKPTAPEPEAPREEPDDFHTFASGWLAAREAEGLAAKTIADLRWALELHLLPHFATFRLAEITPRLVDHYKVAKARERQELEQARARGEEVRERGLRTARLTTR